MLLNITNHPSTAWSINQKQTAETLYGSVIDMPFPNIEPTWTSEQIVTLAKSYAVDIETKYTTPLTVHLMGEMTFTTILVQLLQKNNIACVASTSERVVEEKADGQKVVTFQFVQFRGYSKV